MRVAIYERISQDRSGLAAGVTRQDEDNRALAAELGWEIAGVYVDNDTSATSGKPRQEYDRMLADIAAGRITAVIAWHADRLYRRVQDLEHLIELCEKHHIVIRTCRAGEMDLSTPTGRMLARILGSVASHEGEQKADRWKRSYQQRREAGEVYRSGPRHFGYERDGTINEAEADTIRWAASELLAGVSIRRLCRELDARGVPTTLGNMWRPESLRVTLASPRMAGLSVLRGEIVGAGNWDPILDRPTWEAVRAAVTKKANPNLPTGRVALLSAIAFCGQPGCGKRLYRSRRNGSPIYTCKKDNHQAVGHVAVQAEPAEEVVESYAKEKLRNRKVRRALARRTSGAAASEDLVVELDLLEGRLTELEQELRSAAGRAASALSRAITEVEAEVETKRRDLARLPQVELPVGDEWPDDVERRAALIRLVVARVWVDPVGRVGRFAPERIRIEPGYGLD